MKELVMNKTIRQRLLNSSALSIEELYALVQARLYEEARLLNNIVDRETGIQHLEDEESDRKVER